MKSIADGLPPEIARQIHPDWRKNEQEYWAVRDQLLEQYRDQWIGFADGKVIAAGKRSVEVLHAAKSICPHPFFICVGRETEGVRIRRCSFPYDTRYLGAALPLMDVEFRHTSGVQGVQFDRVIPDTGADTSILPWTDCQILQLDPNLGLPGSITGVTGASANSIIFQIWVQLDGQQYPGELLADLGGSERLHGRDVLNQLEILFRGPTGEVVVNP